MIRPARSGVLQNLPRRVVSRRAGDAAAWMRARAAHVKPLQRSAVVAVTQHGPRAVQLIEAERTMEDVAADEPETPLEVQRRQRLVTQHAVAEVRRVARDGVDHQLRDAIPFLVPGTAIRQLGRDMLAEQAGDMPA